MAHRQQRRPKRYIPYFNPTGRKYTNGEIIRNRVILGGVYAGAAVLGLRAYRSHVANKALKAGIKAAQAAKALRTPNKVGRWKATHNKTLFVGMSGRAKVYKNISPVGRISVTRRGLSAVANTVKRRRSTTVVRKRIIKAGSKTRAAFNNLPRRVNTRRR